MRFLQLILIPVILIGTYSCNEKSLSVLEEAALIPYPASVTNGEGEFILDTKVRIVLAGEEMEKFGKLLAVTMQEHMEIKPLIVQKERLFGRGDIVLVLDTDLEFLDEQYELDISAKKITLVAASMEGLFRGWQSLLQIMLLEKEKEVIALPAGIIKDKPEYAYRGSMLDVSRHFFPPETVKSYIDYLAFYKMNHLHLHLSDDQGWRIEIKSWPELTLIGGSTEVGGGEGGYYTQEEYVDLVNYASDRFITIVPEIDMPGHTNAALASYAELNCDGVARDLYTGTRVGFSTLCTRNENTYEFIDDVIGEICAMTPGPYFHMGGDESHVTALDDYVYFVNRVRQIVKKHGKVMIGWDEISHAELAEEDVAQYWASEENALRALEKGASLILSPAKYCYLDMQYDSSTTLGLHWAAYIEVDDAYQWDPLELVDGINREHILGIESPLWSETIETLDDIEYLAFPRLTAHAEIGWTTPGERSWEKYQERLAAHGSILENMAIDFYPSPLINWH